VLSDVFFLALRAHFKSQGNQNYKNNIQDMQVQI
jgi:hypothetical protein